MLIISEIVDFQKNDKKISLKTSRKRVGKNKKTIFCLIILKKSKTKNNYSSNFSITLTIVLRNEIASLLLICNHIAMKTATLTS